MPRLRLLCAIGVCVWSTVVACGQSGDFVVLPVELQVHLRGERFDIVTSTRGLPLGVRNRLKALFGSPELDIAEPGAAFQTPGPNVDATLHLRRLAVAGCSSDHCLVYYERGGSAHTWHAALFHWTPAETRFEGGGMAPRDLTTVDDVMSALLSGAIKNPTSLW